MSKKQRKQSGGVDIRDVKGSIDVGRDVVGGDKIEEYIHMDAYAEEKSGCAFAFERAYTFVIALLIGGGIFVVIGALIGAGVGGENGAVVGGAIGLLIGLGSAIVATTNVSRHRSA